MYKNLCYGLGDTYVQQWIIIVPTYYSIHKNMFLLIKKQRHIENLFKNCSIFLFFVAFYFVLIVDLSVGTKVTRNIMQN